MTRTSLRSAGRRALSRRSVRSGALGHRSQRCAISGNLRAPHAGDTACRRSIRWLFFVAKAIMSRSAGGLSLGKSGRVADDWLPLIVSGAWLTTMNAWSEPALLTAARQRRSRSGRWPAQLCALATEAPGVLWKGPGRAAADARMAMALRPR